MARSAPARQRSDLISTLTDTIASHPRLSAAVAFQMGLLLGQVMNNRSAAMRALKQGVGAAPAALASALPDFGLFDGGAAPRSSARRSARKTTRRKRRRAA